MELTCVLVLLIVGLTKASPYGYGTKGGAAAKADASAVASAYAGSDAVPLSIPSGGGYSGSFSKSYSSSSASSSASSSSSSFSYSGSGAVGGSIPGSNGCGTGNCNSGAALGSQSSAAAGSQTYSGDNAGFMAGKYGGKTPTGSYGIGNSQANEAQNCGSKGCQSTKGSLTGHGAGANSQSISDAKATASAADENLKSSGCDGSECNELPGSNIKCSSGQCDSNTKCSSGDCGRTSSQDSGNKCTSGQCASNQDVEGSFSIGFGTDDIHVPLHESSNSKSSYGASGSGCSNGNCGLSSATGSPIVPEFSKPATDLTVPKLEPTCIGPNCQHSPSCSGGNCNVGYNPTKAPFVSTNSLNQLSYSPSSPGYGGLSKPGYSHGLSSSHSSTKPGCAPGTPGCSTGHIDNGPSDCISGNCGLNSPALGYGGSLSKPSDSHGSSSLSSFGPTCAPGIPGCGKSPSTSGPSGCVSGNCGIYPTSYSITSTKPGYVHGISSADSLLKPPEPACIPGTPGCGTASSSSIFSDCASGNCDLNPLGPGYSGLSSIKPSYSHGSSPSYAQLKPLEPACAPGRPGCDVIPSVSGSLDCVSGNCGTFPSASGYEAASSTKPSYSQGISPPYSSSMPLGPACKPGTPGCVSIPSGNGPSNCASGNCGSYPSVPSFDSIPSIKPSYPHGTSHTYSQANLSGPACAPGTPGCASTISDSSHPGYGGSSSIKPSYSHVSSPAFTAPSVLDCAPGTPGCGQVPSGSGPSSCASGNCGSIPSIPGYGTSSSIIPSYSHGGSPSYSPVNPSGQTCAPGSPGCTISPSAPFSCTSGNCGGNTPSRPHGSSPSHSQVQPSGPACAPGTQGCGITSFPSGSASSSCTTGNCGAFPSTSPHGCAPGATGCSGAPPITFSPGYGSSGVGSTLNQANIGSHGTGTIQTSFIKPPTGYPSAPSGPGVVPGIGSSSYLGNVGATTGSSTQEEANKKPTYTGGFGGPAGILRPNEFSAPSPTYGNKPAILSGSPAAKPSCTSGNCDQSSASGAQATPGTLLGSSSRPSTGILLLLGHGASGGESSSNQANFGSHGTGSIQTSYNKPTTIFPKVPPSSDAVSGIGSPPYTSNFGATAASSVQQVAKEKQPLYTGGFGGPNGILKPNEFNAASPTYGNKPALSTGTLAAKPSCTTGNCDQSSSASGAQATAGASASSSAVAYTGGFGGPPGILKPYDNGKVDLKALPGSSLGLHEGLSGSGIHSSPNDGSQVGGSARAQAKAAAISATGVGGGNSGYSHGHDAAGGCGGGCGGSGAGNFGYSSSLGFSKTGVLDDPSSGLATAGAVAKTHSSSGARAYGGSYASSSASAHASSGASVKGGYGRR